jgi:hypothetical protein
MPHFRCLVRGVGFHGIVEGREGPMGFYVTRAVDAAGVAQAQLLVITAFQEELAARGWADKGGRLVVEEIDVIETSDSPDVPPGFVFFVDDEAEDLPKEAGPLPPFLLLTRSGFSVLSDALEEPWMMTRKAMNDFREALCYDSSGTVRTIIDVVPLRAMTLGDRLFPWRQYPARLVLERGPDLSINEVRGRLVAMLEGESAVADHLTMTAEGAIDRLSRATTPPGLIEAAQAIMSRRP